MTKSTVQSLAKQYVLARRLAAEAEETAKSIQERLLPLISAKLVVDMGDGDFAILALVAPIRTSWIAARVKALLPVKLWNRVKTEAVNKTILEAMITSGELAGYDLSEAREVLPSKPYLRITEKPAITAAVPIIRKEVG